MKNIEKIKKPIKMRKASKKSTLEEWMDTIEDDFTYTYTYSDNVVEFNVDITKTIKALDACETLLKELTLVKETVDKNHLLTLSKFYSVKFDKLRKEINKLAG